MRRGIPIVISAASGTGKSSLCRRLLQTLSGTETSVSYTTRAPRGEEVDGRHYHFVDRPQFTKMIEAGELIEWAEVFGNLYGTGLGAVEAQLGRGVDVLLDIDVQGGLQLKRRLPETLLIFLLPPSMAELRRRLEARAEDSPERIESRLAEARRELSAAVDYAYLVENDDFDRAALELRAIIRAERLRRLDPHRRVKALLADP